MRLIVTGLALWLAGTTAAAAADLQVVIKRIPDARGVIRIAVYPEATFLKSTRPQLQWLMKAKPGTLSHIFRGIPAGRYAVVAFQDANNNGRVDRSAVGIPTEKVAFSNDAVGVAGPPKFAQAAIALGPRPRSVTLTFD